MNQKLPLPSDKLHAPFKIAALVETLEEQGVAPDLVLRGTGLSPAQLQDALTKTSVRQYVDACANAIRLSNDPHIPFLVGSKLNLFKYGMYGYAAMSCPTLREYFRIGERYHLLAAPMMAVQWNERPEDECSFWKFPNEFILSNSIDLSRFLIEQQFTQHVTHLKDAAGPSYAPRLAHFAYNKPSHAELYFKYIECDCIFGQKETRLFYDNKILDDRPCFSHSIAFASNQLICEKIIRDIQLNFGIGGEVYRFFIDHPGLCPGMDTVSKSMNTTPRTLRRRLALEGLTFAEIVDDVRRTLSIEYLKKTSFSIDDVAHLVGFSDVSNFRKAFRRWTGVSPSRFRI